LKEFKKFEEFKNGSQESGGFLVGQQRRGCGSAEIQKSNQYSVMSDVLTLNTDSRPTDYF
jgi:hypothetical protein